MKIVVATLGVIIIGVIAFFIFQTGLGRNANSNVSVTSSINTTQNSTMDSNERIRVRIGDQTYTVTMFDNPTAKDLLSQLPLTLTFRDYQGQEIESEAPRALTMQGVPAGADPEINDLGYYAPANTIIFYYSDVGYFDGIVRLGKFDSNIESFKNLSDDITVTMERAN